MGVQYVSLLLAFLGLICNINYFLRDKSMYRWIKLFYALTLASILIIHGLHILNIILITATTHDLLVTGLLSVIFAGSVVSMIKANIYPFNFN